MLSFSIIETEVRDFMNKLLREGCFDSFEVREVDICSFARFVIGGVMPEEADEDGKDSLCYCTWGELRPYVFNIIKGRRPRAFKIVLSLTAEHAAALHNNMSACFLNLMFDGNRVICTASASEKTFALDRAADGIWQEYILKFFKENKITVRKD